MAMKSVSGLVMTLFLMSMLTLTFNIPNPRAFGTSVNTCAVALEDGSGELTHTVFLPQSFDNETTGSTPKNWSMLLGTAKFGNFTVDKNVYYGKSGKSAKFFDNSTIGSPIPYRNFTEQTDTIVVMLAIKLTSNTGNNAGLEVRVDDGNLAGSNIIFANDSTIRYRDHNGQLKLLRDSYLPNRWYRIKIIMNIRDNRYNIHIDDHLDALNVKFVGACTQIHRIIINGTSPSLQPIGYIDDVEVRKCIEVPDDYPTIQKGVNAANPGDIIFVKNRTYYENITITKSVWLIGEDRNTTIIDACFTLTAGRVSSGILVKQCNNVTICGFTIKNTEANGVFVQGLNHTISNNIITFSLGCGIRIVGSNSTVTSNIIESNEKCGIYIADGEENVVKKNIIKGNGVGLKCDAGTKDNIIYQNRFICNSLQFLDYGSNTWHDDYPYKPDKEKGGGNYWSDHVSVDMYSGKNQDEHGPCCTPLPDGICDTPYSNDRYPLFLIQKVIQKPDTGIDYTKDVKVNATILQDVKVEEAKIYVSYDSRREVLPMKIVGENLNGTIPRKRYGTEVRYNISVHAYCAVWLNSTNYPLELPYRVIDLTKPAISDIKVDPFPPNEDQLVRVNATVTEPAFASGVDKVILSYNVSASWWKTEMIKIIFTNIYRAVMPKQPGGRPLNFTIQAFDKAGNNATVCSMDVPDLRTDIQYLAKLSVTYKGVITDPCNIDFEVMSKNEVKEDTIRIENVGQEPLEWKIIAVKPSPWFSLNVTIDKFNITRPGKYTTIKIKVNTTGYSDPLPCVGEFSVKANGSVPEWTIIARVMVMHIVIDESWASVEIPNRCDVGSTQRYAFHVIWAHNETDATNGRITVSSGVGLRSVNRTGWVVFTYSLSNPGQKTFTVENVRFQVTYKGKVYYITSFTQKARNLTTIWDRVNIILSISDDRIDMGTVADVSWRASVYEFDNSTFQGYPQLNDTLYHDTVGKWCITTSSIVDSKYHLTNFTSNTVCCIWDRIKIIGGGVSQLQTSVGQTETVWFIAVYEYDNKVFKGTMGNLYISVSENTHEIIRYDPMNWASEKDVWEKSYSFNTPCTRTFRVSKVSDNLYNLARINDSVGPLSITWETPLGRQYILTVWPWAALAIIVASFATVMPFWVLEKKRGNKQRR